MVSVVLVFYEKMMFCITKHLLSPENEQFDYAEAALKT